MAVQLILGNSYDKLKDLPDNSVDSVVTDPPYGLGKEPNAVELLQAWATVGYYEVKGKGFMGKSWDAFVPQPLLWKEVFRVLKPGGHLLSFFGTRTYDWGVMAIRLAGFEIRDCMMWVYGQGQPHGLNISKAIDKHFGLEREVIGKVNKLQSYSEDTLYGGMPDKKGVMNITKPACEESEYWQDWNTALKPALEPICVAQKPIEKGLSIVQNILKWGVGALNIGACRIVGEDNPKKWSTPKGGYWQTDSEQKAQLLDNENGRYPANLILDDSAEVDAAFAEYGEKKSGFMSGEIHKRNETAGEYQSKNGIYGTYKMDYLPTTYGDQGSVKRFFYCAKADDFQREAGLEEFDKNKSNQKTNNHNIAPYGRETVKANEHPTVKPIDLMRYLVQLVTPKGGTVLDPFMGSGTTGCACQIPLESYNFIGIELEEKYLKISEARIKWWSKQAQKGTKPKRAKALPKIETQVNLFN